MKRFFGGLLMTAGALIGGLSGLCTLIFVVMGMGTGGDNGLIIMALMIGAVPMVVGAGLFVAGRVLWRSKPPPPPPEVF